MAELDFKDIKKVQLALLESDAIALRCFKAGIPFPADWKTYVQKLEAERDKSFVGNAINFPARPVDPA